MAHDGIPVVVPAGAVAGWRSGRGVDVLSSSGSASREDGVLAGSEK